jgi:hypothetical protein
MVLGLCIPASADVGLNDWCVNVNGDTNTACNGGTGGTGGLGMGGPSGLATINLGGFDTTLEPSGSNKLGSIVVTLGAGNNQNAAVYMNYDLDYATTGDFQDYGSVNGSPGPEASYELNDPNVCSGAGCSSDPSLYGSDIFYDFSQNALSNANSVGTFVNSPPTVCCDVAWALGLSGINVAAGGSDIITFTVSTSPPSGFYLQETNGQDADSIYLSVSEDLIAPTGGGGPTTTPEPTGWLLLATVIAGIGISLKKAKQRSVAS